VGAAFSRDHFISRLKAAPTGIFFRNLGFPDKRLLLYSFLIFEALTLSPPEAGKP
jgi:hypothetical protein